MSGKKVEEDHEQQRQKSFKRSGNNSNLQSSLLLSGTRLNEWGAPMRLELTRVGLLV